MSCTKGNFIFSRLFSKLAHNFSAIELLAFFKIQNSIFLLLKRDLSNWAKYIYIPYVKMIIFLLFMYIIHFYKKKYKGVTLSDLLSM